MRTLRRVFDHYDLTTDVDNERQVALEYLADAWNAAEGDGIDSDALAHAALFAALATLVQTHGEEAAAMIAANLPQKLREGEYSVGKMLQ